MFKHMRYQLNKLLTRASSKNNGKVKIINDENHQTYSDMIDDANMMSDNCKHKDAPKLNYLGLVIQHFRLGEKKGTDPKKPDGKTDTSTSVDPVTPPVEPVAPGSGKGRFGDLTFLDTEAHFTHAKGLRQKFLASQKTLVATRARLANAYFNANDRLAASRRTAAAKLRALTAAKKAHADATAERVRLEKLVEDQEKAAHDAKDVWTGAKQTHDASNLIWLRLKRELKTANGVVDATTKTLAADKETAEKAKKAQDDQQTVVNTDHAAIAPAQKKAEAAADALAKTVTALTAATTDAATKKTAEGTAQTAHNAAQKAKAAALTEHTRSKAAAIAAHNAAVTHVKDGKLDW